MGDDIFIKKIRDVYRLSEKYHCPKFSHFLDATQQAEIISEGLFEAVLFGGYEDAERKMLGVFPDWMESEEELFPIKAVRFIKKYDKVLSHRDYLGTVMSQGIERNKIGDILVLEDGAFLICEENIAGFIKDNINKVAGIGVETSILALNEIIIPKRQFQNINAVSASERLDAVLAALLKISRSEAKVYVTSGKVSVNHIPEENPSRTLPVGSILSVRGFGRAELTGILGETRSGRIHIVFKKYI